jgi:hypothetical protein
VSRRKAGLYSIPETLGQALYHLVHHSPQSVAAQAEQLHLSPQFIYNIGNPNLEVEGVAYPLKHLVPHTRLTRNFVVVDFIESQLGRVGVFLPSVEGVVAPATAENLPASVCRLMQEIGDVARESTQRLHDRELSHEDRLQLQKEVHDVLQLAAQILAALKEAASDA